MQKVIFVANMDLMIKNNLNMANKIHIFVARITLAMNFIFELSLNCAKSLVFNSIFSVPVKLID